MGIKLKITSENKRMFIIIGAVVVAIIVILLIIGSSKKDNKEIQQAGTNEQNIIVIDAPKLSEVRKYKNFDISNIKIIVENSITKISAEVTNNTSLKTEEEWIDINVLDEDGKIVTKVAGHIDELEPGETQTIKSQILSNGQDKRAYDIKITELIIN